MKKERHPLISEPTTVVRAKEQLPSIELTLRLLNKEKERKDIADEAAKVRCRTCFKEIAPKRLCSGHGTGSNGGDNVTSDKTSEVKASFGKDIFLIKSGNVVDTIDEKIIEFDSEELDLDSNYDPEIIAELIAKGLLLVDSDRESMTLTIQLQYEPCKLAEVQRKELRKFMEAIIKEFNELKEEIHLSNKYIQIIQDENGNIHFLRITMPTLVLYDAFIQRLANNLVPSLANTAERGEVTTEQGFSPNPLSRGPKPSNQDQSSKQEANEQIHNTPEDEEHIIFNPSPFTDMKP